MGKQVCWNLHVSHRFSTHLSCGEIQLSSSFLLQGLKIRFAIGSAILFAWSLVNIPPTSIQCSKKILFYCFYSLRSCFWRWWKHFILIHLISILNPYGESCCHQGNRITCSPNSLLETTACYFGFGCSCVSNVSFGLGLFWYVFWLICMLMDHLASLQELHMPRQKCLLPNRSISMIRAEGNYLEWCLWNWGLFDYFDYLLCQMTSANLCCVLLILFLKLFFRCWAEPTEIWKWMDSTSMCCEVMLTLMWQWKCCVWCNKSCFPIIYWSNLLWK